MGWKVNPLQLLFILTKKDEKIMRNAVDEIHNYLRTRNERSVTPKELIFIHKQIIYAKHKCDPGFVERLRHTFELLNRKLLVAKRRKAEEGCDEKTSENEDKFDGCEDLCESISQMILNQR